MVERRSEPELIKGQLVSEIDGWYEMLAVNQNTGEPEVHRLYKHSTKKRPVEEDLVEKFQPAKRAEIHPTRRKQIQKIGKQILVFADTQIGYRRVRDTRTDEEVLMSTHSEDVLDIIVQLNADLMPKLTLNLSDTADFAEFSRFFPDSDHFHRTLAPSLQRVHDFYAQLYADNPHNRRIEVDSNHTIRPTKAMLRKMPELYGMTLPNEKYPLLSYYRLAALDGLVDFISGYGQAQYVHGEEYGKEPIVAKHGVYTSAVPGGVVRKEMQDNPETHLIRGHGHSYEEVSRIARSGNQLRYIQLGAACLNNGRVPSYRSAVDDFGIPVKGRENWPNQLMVIEDFEDGIYNFNVLDVIAGAVRYQDKEYRSRVDGI